MKHIILIIIFSLVMIGCSGGFHRAGPHYSDIDVRVHPGTPQTLHGGLAMVWADGPEAVIASTGGEYSERVFIHLREANTPSVTRNDGHCLLNYRPGKDDVWDQVGQCFVQPWAALDHEIVFHVLGDGHPVFYDSPPMLKAGRRL